MVYSIYIHIPFCQRRCNYCDFVTYAGMTHTMPAYFGSLIEEFRIVTKNIFKPFVHTIYFGGGTPSLVPIKYYRQVLTELSKFFHFSPDCELSLEANPGTLSYGYLAGLKELGFNRLSIGVQSMQASDLKRLERIHSIADIYQSVSDARRAGFENINLDLIFGLPWQTQLDWENTLKKANELQPEHFSLYSLLIEPGTKLFNWYQKGLIVCQDQDQEGDMYEFAINFLKEADYQHYEISNWSKIDSTRDFRSRHNLQYWLYQPYLGFGVGAHGFVFETRTANVTSIPEYCDRIKIGKDLEIDFPRSPANVTSIKLEPLSQMKEFMMLGLRLVEDGVSAEKFYSLFGTSMMAIFGDEITRLISRGLLSWSGKNNSTLRLTKRGILLGNQVFMAFV